jgi:hypothetical protein
MLHSPSAPLNLAVMRLRNPRLPSYHNRLET